jgi:hypothetical protein
VHLTAPYSIQRRDNRFGFNFKPIRVYFGETDNYWLHHVIDHVDKGGPAEEAGLKPDMVITYVNGEVRVWDGIHISCLLVLLCMCCLHAVVVVIYRK